MTRLRRPTSIEETLEAVEDDDAVLLAGGVSLVLLMNAGFLDPGVLVSLERVRELRGVRQTPDGIDIGAMCTHAELAASPIVVQHAAALSDAFARVGNVRVRSWGTLGGNLAHADPAQDPPTVLSVLGARVRIVSPRGRRDVRVEELADGPLAPRLDDDELITRIELPTLDVRARTAYVKFLPGTRDDYATVNVAVHVEVAGDGRIQAARLAAGAVGPTVLALDDAMSPLLGHRPEPDVLAAVAAAVREAVRPTSDVRGSADYKRHLAGELSRRAVLSCVGGQR